MKFDFKTIDRLYLFLFIRPLNPIKKYAKTYPACPEPTEASAFEGAGIERSFPLDASALGVCVLGTCALGMQRDSLR